MKRDSSSPRGWRQRLRGLWSDQDGAVAVEYVLLTAITFIGFLWFNKAADAILFGADPFTRYGRPSESDTSVLPTEDEDWYDGGPTSLPQYEQLLAGIAAEGGNEHAYLSQLYIHLSRP